MTPEETAEKLKALGIDFGNWGTMGERMVSPVSVGKQRELLLQFRDMLQTFVDKDQDQVAKLKEKIARLQHGGGM
jgi:hypothetical protein